MIFVRQGIYSKRVLLKIPKPAIFFQDPRKNQIGVIIGRHIPMIKRRIE